MKKLKEKLYMCSVCLVVNSCLTFVTPWTLACQAPLSMGFPRQEYWSMLPFPPPGDLPDPGIESPTSCVSNTAGLLLLSHHGSPAGL